MTLYKPVQNNVQKANDPTTPRVEIGQSGMRYKKWVSFSSQRYHFDLFSVSRISKDVCNSTTTISINAWRTSDSARSKSSTEGLHSFPFLRPNSWRMEMLGWRWGVVGLIMVSLPTFWIPLVRGGPNRNSKVAEMFNSELKKNTF